MKMAPKQLKKAMRPVRKVVKQEVKKAIPIVKKAAINYAKGRAKAELEKRGLPTDKQSAIEYAKKRAEKELKKRGRKLVAKLGNEAKARLLS